MRRLLLMAGLVACGCVSGPMVENPVPLLAPPPGAVGSSPVFLPQSSQGYPRVFEKCLDVVSDYFEIDTAGTNRYAGVIRTNPAIAPGIEQPWKPGSPDLYQRLLAFKQTIRHRAVVEIAVGRDGGYFVHVKVLKELEDLERPSRATAGLATFRLENTVERQYDVVEAGRYDTAWIPLGRDAALEQVMLERIARLDCER